MDSLPAFGHIFACIYGNFVGKSSESKHGVDGCGNCLGRVVLNKLEMKSFCDIAEINEDLGLSFPIFDPKGTSKIC